MTMSERSEGEKAPREERELPYPWEQRLGAQPGPEGTTFRVWAPFAKQVSLRLGTSEATLADAGWGVWEGRFDAEAGEDYWFLLQRQGSELPVRLPDPCSRHQPGGLRGPSRIFDPSVHRWQDEGFEMAPLADSVIYELHVGTFTEEGTFRAACGQLRRLARLGVSAIELMPVAEGPGNRGWGYDGVYTSAPHHAYGGPEALQQLVDAAHSEGIGVILDVVYNHLGAAGVRAMEAFGPYFTDRYQTFWGKAMNFDGELCDPVREWALQNAEGWVRDYHIDGLRLDAVHAIFDESAKPIVAEITQRVHAANGRAIVIAESSSNDPRVIRPVQAGGLGCDAQWADDFHHSLHTLLTGETDGYYADFGRVSDLAKAYRRPFVYDGRYSAFRKRRVGAPAFDRDASQFVVFCENHDQVGNRAFGERLPRQARPLAAMCLLFSPFVPMLFMGEEYGEPAPFQYFTDHIDAAIAKATREGRQREFAAFQSFRRQLPDPQDRRTFAASKLTGRRDEILADLYAALIVERRQLTGEAEVIGLSEAERWLWMRRGDCDMICNFSSRRQSVATDRSELVICTAEATLTDGAVTLPPLSGALLR